MKRLWDRFAAVLDEPGRPVAFDAARVSRDPETWTALGTYRAPTPRSVMTRRLVRAFRILPA